MQKNQKTKHLFIKAGPACDLTECQKSIYLAKQGGRSQPGLKNWVSGRLSPSALSQLGMRVLHHPTRSVTPAGQLGGKSNGGVVLSTSTLPVPQQGLLWFSTHASPAHEQRGSTLVTAHDQGHYHCPR